MTHESHPDSLLGALGLCLLRLLTAVGGLLVYAAVLLILAVVGGPFSSLFTVLNYSVMVAAAIWALMPMFRYLTRGLFDEPS